MHILDSVDSASLRSDVPAFGAGDTLKVHVNIIEGKNSRVQVFQGYVLGRQGRGVGETFTVRKVSFGTGVVQGRRTSCKAVLHARSSRQGCSHPREARLRRKEVICVLL